MKIDVARANLHAARFKDADLADWARTNGEQLLAEIDNLNELLSRELQLTKELAQERNRLREELERTVTATNSIGPKPMRGWGY